MRLWGAPHSFNTLVHSSSQAGCRRWRARRPRPRPRPSLTGRARSCPSACPPLRYCSVRPPDPSAVGRVAAPGVGHPSSFSPFIAIFRDVIMRVVARMVARVARREKQPARGNSQLRVSLSTGCREPRLRQAQMDSGGFVVFGFLAALRHGTTIFLICEFLRFVHNESFTGLDILGRRSSEAAY